MHFVKKSGKFLLVSVAAVSSLLASLSNAYAIETTTTQSAVVEATDPSSAVKEYLRSGFDYSVYSEKTAKDYLRIIDEISEVDILNKGLYDYLRFEIKGLEFKGKEDISGYYLLRDRMLYGFDDINIKVDDQTSFPLKEAYKNIDEIEFDEFRETQCEWSKHFLQLMSVGFDYSKKDFNLKSIDIYEYFADGIYKAPVKNPSLDRINRKYEKGHYGVDIKMDEEEAVYSIANNAQVFIKGDDVVLLLKNNVEVTYRNVVPEVKTGDIVSAGEKIGTYVQKNNQYDGLFVAMSKEKKEVSIEWMLTELPFITNHGMSMPLYIQFSDLFDDVPFGTSTIGPSGCGPSSLAMALSYVKNEIITPAEVVEVMGGAHCPYYVEGAGSSWSIMLDCPPEFGVSAKALYSSEVYDALIRGHPVIVLMRAGEFTSGGHFITLSGFDADGRVYVNDSADNTGKKHYERTFTLDQIFAESGGGYWELWLDESGEVKKIPMPEVSKDITKVKKDEVKVEVEEETIEIEEETTEPENDKNDEAISTEVKDEALSKNVDEPKGSDEIKEIQKQ